MTIEPLQMLTGLITGVAMAIGYLLLLWRSLRAMATRPNPARALLVGALARLALVAGGLATLAGLGLDTVGLVAWLAGFTAVRLLAVGRVRPTLKQGSAP